VDVGISGTGPRQLQLAGTPSLRSVVEDVARSIPSPETGTAGSNTLYDMWLRSFTDPTPPPGYSLPYLDASGMGTGSDYGAFMQHLGIVSLDARIGSVPNPYEGVYHSNYDDYYWMTKFSDPSFVYHRAIAHFWGVLAIRLATTPVLPFIFVPYSTQLRSNLWLIANGTACVAPNFSASTTHSDAVSRVSTGADSNKLNFTSLAQSLDRLVETATKVDAVVAELISFDSNAAASGDETADDAVTRRILNDRLFLAERAFLFLQGIRGREWYRHMVWVSSEYDGYGSVAFSVICDKIQTGLLDEAQFQIQLSSLVVDQASDWLDEISAA